MDKKVSNRSSRIKIVILSAVVFFVAVTGMTYAYFTIQIEGNEEASSIRLTTANLSLIYTDVQVRGGTNVYPGWSTTKTITVENDGSTSVYYNIIWRELYNEIINEEMQISAVCSSSISENDCGDISPTPILDTYAYTTSLVQVGNMQFQQVETRGTDPYEFPNGGMVFPNHFRIDLTKYVKKGIYIEPGEIHTYVVTIEFLETGSYQDYNQGKEFYGTLNIEEGSSITLTSQASDMEISVGDQARIGDEEFYVVSSNADETVLLAKYNLLVGDDITTNSDYGTYTHEPADSNGGEFGIQSNSTGEGQAVSADHTVPARVPFSSTIYWYDDENSTISSEYGTIASNNIYDSNYSQAPQMLYDPEDYPSVDWNNENNYSVAYYVNRYVQYLKTLGAGSTIQGRLLTYDEAISLGLGSSQNQNAPNWARNTSYWLGSVPSDSIDLVYGVTYNSLYGQEPGYSNLGVRPVIVVPTGLIS